MGSYLITYNYTVRGCGATGSSSRVIAGDTRELSLSPIEENTDYIVSIRARNDSGESESVSVMTTTLMAGKIEGGFQLVTHSLCLHVVS